METPETQAPAEGAPAAAEPAKPAPKNKGGRPKGSKSRKTLEREVKRLREKVEKDPFADDVRASAPPAGGDAPADAPPAAGNGPVNETVISAEETPQLGTEAARAMAPAYYRLVNFGSGFLFKNSPALKADPKAMAAVVKQTQLDARGYYVGEVLTNASEDRQAIDPSLIPVLAKLRLTPELALVITTVAIVLGKYAMATGDAEVLEMLSVLSPQPNDIPTTATPTSGA